jgi:hypothetical protein
LLRRNHWLLVRSTLLVAYKSLAAGSFSNAFGCVKVAGCWLVLNAFCCVKVAGCWLVLTRADSFRSAAGRLAR